jgi:uncharacterized protein DUF6352
MRDFWLSCGHHLTDRDAGGGLVVTDEFLKAYLARPELTPPPDAGVVERTLHAVLLDDPRRRVDAAEIAAIEDADARENFSVLLAWRDHLLRHRTLEATYLALMRHGVGRTPALFINQLVHLILRNALDDCEDPFVLRAAELMFRPQRLTVHDGSLIAADDELISGANATPVSPLVSMMGLSPAGDIDVLGEDNAEDYFARSDRFDMALDLTAGRRGHAALAQAMESFIAHLLALEVDIAPLSELREVRLSWYVGLDADGTRIGDRLWNAEPLDEATARRVVALYRLTFRDPSVMAKDIAGEPVYLILAMTPELTLRMKPQNLIVGLPVRDLETVS